MINSIINRIINSITHNIIYSMINGIRDILEQDFFRNSWAVPE
jgi:hypothetical protein